ncbi:glycosyltransferase [Novosphingobium sp. FSY-8]|uniref:Glycosyltransferase n=1 Tax=Novosphingobium ovatum TaxID=1908523 RepID=A0ABW9XGG3_9SPHN|nr:glycosyltransferase family 4 protein [Novosphingobium ovatum]NBC37650.1 glycosyltransferase [Novosphingobium ovatum]
MGFWAHGWRREESWLKGKLRNLYFGLANRALVYSNRAVELARQTGFDDRRITVIYNSLDWDAQCAQFEALDHVPMAQLRAELNLPEDAAILLTISRITDICQYDWLVDAAASVDTQGRPLVIVMIGTGPAEQALQAQARERGVDLRCVGSIYDETRIASYVMAADCVVSPGKVGLTAMHALAYGTPVVTHSDLDRQMPEVEAVIEGQSGAFFPYGSVSGLADAISRLLAWPMTVGQRREACRGALIGRFTPQVQRELIDDAVDAMLRG